MIGEVLYKPGSRHIKTMGAWRGMNGVAIQIAQLESFEAETILYKTS